ncbi:MAG: sigma-70 family RNA polymerase sigma factor [Gemmatimonadota bacterium]|jgi:RNA polymerase sigma-70 factor (ECF subfamily)|nr:sigma-70 family RNA polymerase sigma factor [Gemmatimonadota bacterium]
MNQTTTDDELVRRARDGDREAIGKLYERHASRVYALTRRLAGNDEMAADWAQDTWLHVVRALPGFRGESRFSTWLYRITVNTVLHGFRSNQRRRGRLGELAGEVAGEIAMGPRTPADSQLTRLTVEEAVDRLPPGMRQVIVLHDIEGYTHEEIGQMLGINPGTCKSQLFKARGKLREILEPSGIEGRVEGKVDGESICI